MATESPKGRRESANITSKAKRLHEMMDEAARLSAEIDAHLQRSSHDRIHGKSEPKAKK